MFGLAYGVKSELTDHHLKSKRQVEFKYFYLSFCRAVGEARTRDPQLGKLMLYQLSYYRNANANVIKNLTNSVSFPKNGRYYFLVIVFLLYTDGGVCLIWIFCLWQEVNGEKGDRLKSVH